MLRTIGLPAGIDALSLFSSDVGIKSHARYVDAKAGNAAAALDLVMDVAVSWLHGHRERFVPGCLLQNARLIWERFSHEFIQIFGIDAAALTANEARYIVGFKSADALRDSLAKARKEINV